MEVVMLERYFVRPQTVDRIRSSWIGGAIEQYVAWLSENGYASRNVFRRVPILVGFGEFSQKRGAKEWDELPGHIGAFSNWWASKHGTGQRSPTSRKKVVAEARNPIEQMLRLVIPCFAGTGRSHKPENPFEDQAPGFFQYLREERGLRPSTIWHYEHGLRHFAGYLKKINLTALGHLSAPVLSAFVMERAQKPLCMATRSNICGILRVFLRYLHREGVLDRDLARTVEFPQEYRLSHIPRSITWDEVRRVLQAVDRRTPAGKRDYAMLLLLVTYGLRAHEVAALTLDDIDWRNGRLRIPERKAGHSTAYPLSPLVGQTIIEYLKEGRPKTTDRHVFFRVLAPYKPITSAVLSCRARDYLLKAGISCPRPGSHTFRHTCVQRLIDAEFTLKTIGDYVGHRSPASTEIYTKVDIEALREVACGDGEDVV
jgi:site-specific recombinase XerD